MDPVQGRETAYFGKWLTDLVKRLRAENINVYYDHGDRRANSNVAAIKGFVGDVVSNLNRLADLDVLVAQDDEACLLIEIEEHPPSPKKVLGDVLAAMLCNRFAVKVDGHQRYFRVTQRTRLIIAAAIPGAGKGLFKIGSVIVPLLKQISGPPFTLRSDNVELLFSCSLIDTLNNLKEKTEIIVNGIT